MSLNRRSSLLSLAIATLAVASPRVTNALAPTRRMTEGPFYPYEIPLEHDADLTRVDGSTGAARGEVLDLTGRVLDVHGRVQHGVEIEIWQCDANGRYHHVDGDGAGGDADPRFQGFGRTTSDARGEYRFRTIRPVAYAGRTPHIHVKLRGPGFADLTTQMFVAGEPGNARDGIYNGIRDDAARAALTVALAARGTPDAKWSGRFDIVLSADGRFDSRA